MPPRLLDLVPLVLLLVTCPYAGASGASDGCPPVPGTMRAARVHGPGGPEALRIEQVPVPVPAAGEVLVRVHYASGAAVMPTT